MDPSSVPDLSQTHPYTCNSCAVAFRNSEAQRTHMRSDWHRYNLKRRIAELPSVSSEEYNDKVLAAQATTNAAAAQVAFEKYCATCQKNYFSENAYQNHIGSQKHKLRLATTLRGSINGSGSVKSSVKSQDDSIPNSETTDPEAEAEIDKAVDGLRDASISEKDPLSRRPSEPHHSGAEQREGHLSPETKETIERTSSLSSSQIPLSRCLFCNYDSPTSKLSVAHMTKIHGLFIPEQNYLTDLEGLLGYLQAKINENHECLYCHKLKTTASGVQTHMRDKGHCKIAFETEEEMIEVGQFYDFSSTYSDPESEDSDTDMDEPKSKSNGGVKLPQTKGENSEDDGWETDSSFSSLDSKDLTSVPNDDHTHQYQRLPLHRHHSHTDPRPHKNADGFHSHAHHHGANAVFYDEHEMYLPSGRVAGHRSLKKYYRQNLHSYPTATERMERAQYLLENGQDEDAEIEDANSSKTSRSQAVMKRDEGGMLGATTSQRQEVRSQEIRGRQHTQRAQNRYQAKLEKQNNSQKHFRVSSDFCFFSKDTADKTTGSPSPVKDDL
jgi:pre-60S factor REI1